MRLAKGSELGAPPPPQPREPVADLIDNQIPLSREALAEGVTRIIAPASFADQEPRQVTQRSVLGQATAYSPKGFMGKRPNGTTARW